MTDDTNGERYVTFKWFLGAVVTVLLAIPTSVITGVTWVDERLEKHGDRPHIGTIDRQEYLKDMTNLQNEITSLRSSINGLRKDLSDYHRSLLRLTDDK